MRELSKKSQPTNPYFLGPIDNRALLRRMAQQIRIDVLKYTYQTKSAHLGSCLSAIDILVALYFGHLKIDVNNTKLPGRDRFILSKGHACLALYCTLHRRGFISDEVLQGYGIDRGTLEHHSKYNLDYGIELSTGSLGHGLPVSCGMAYIGLHAATQFRVFTLMSDGELQEGSNWEAILFAAHHKLGNLTAIIDYNKIQALGIVAEIGGLEPLADKWRSFGWQAHEIDGNNMDDLSETLLKNCYRSEKPQVIIAHTVKGRGISFMENQLLWHYRCPDPNEFEKALSELESGV